VLASAQSLDSRDVVISLEQALPIVIDKAEADFLDVDDYILCSVHPRGFKGDPNGLRWEFVWKAVPAPEGGYRSRLSERRLNRRRTRAGYRAALS
jgi:hypothetical protein